MNIDFLLNLLYKPFGKIVVLSKASRIVRVRCGVFLEHTVFLHLGTMFRKHCVYHDESLRHYLKLNDVDVQWKTLVPETV